MLSASAYERHARGPTTGAHPTPLGADAVEKQEAVSAGGTWQRGHLVIRTRQVGGLRGDEAASLSGRGRSAVSAAGPRPSPGSSRPGPSPGLALPLSDLGEHGEGATREVTSRPSVCGVRTHDFSRLQVLTWSQPPCFRRKRSLAFAVPTRRPSCSVKQRACHWPLLRHRVAFSFFLWLQCLSAWDGAAAEEAASSSSGPFAFPSGPLRLGTIALWP